MQFEDILAFLLQDDPDLPPGTPPKIRIIGKHWFLTQIALSLAIGLTSFLLFSYSRTRWPLLFAPRTKLKGFSPHEAHSQQSFFSWILPTIRTSEFTILQIVGLDAAVLLNFLKMSFYLFSICSVLACGLIMPLNWYVNGRFDTGGPDDDGEDDWPDFTGNNTNPTPPPPKDERDWLDLISEANSYLALHFVCTYIFTLLAMRFLHQNYRRFIRSRQLFSLELVHSIAARTVMVTDLPNHLQGERALAVYFENMNLPVESVSLCRNPGSLRDLIDKRTEALFKLEDMWTHYVGNPSVVEEYDPSLNVRADTAALVDIDDSEAQPNRLVVPHRPRPTLRNGWFKRVDALEHLEAKFKELDEQVQKRRRSGKFKATPVAFVTFETMSSAEIASQVVHTPYHSQCSTCPAPEPRDIVWSNMTHSSGSLRVRELLTMVAMVVLLLFWMLPIGTLATLLSYEEIKKAAPWLGKIVDSNEFIQALVQNTVPSLAVISLNGCLPFFLEGMSYLQGHRARSWIEYSLLKKYFLFLLINVVFIFMLATTYWALVRDLANSPAKVPEKLAAALQRSAAKKFFLSYVVLQGLGIMPLQLLNLGVIIPRAFMATFFTRTPRDYAELNAPPMINYGAVYPQAILIFVITITYSVIQPLILIFGAIYFGVAYVVYKYKLLFVFYKPYESRGQAWPITFSRLMWGVIIFQIFMTGIFTVEKKFLFSTLMLPLIGVTIYWTWSTDIAFQGLSSHTSLSSVFEVQRGEATNDVMKLKMGHPVSLSQSNLNRRRYAQNDETLYVAPEEDRTDYSQPPMANWYNGVLNTGKRRYGHPALTGVLPSPWLPLKKGQTLANYNNHTEDEDAKISGGQAVVLTLRRKASNIKGSSRKRVSTTNLLDTATSPPVQQPGQPPIPSSNSDAGSASNPWRDAPATSSGARRPPLDFDAATGVIMLPDGDDWLEDEVGSSEDEGVWTTSGAAAIAPRVDESTDTSDDEVDVPGARRIVSSVGEHAVERRPTSASPSRRHSTYYHHPERVRRHIMPGAFS